MVSPLAPSFANRSHRQIRDARRLMFAHWGDLCHICGHRGATEADHVIPVKLRPDLVADHTNLRPAHGALYRFRKGPRIGQVLRDARCRQCVAEGKPGTCNQSKGAAYRKVQEGWDPNEEYVPPIVL